MATSPSNEVSEDARKRFFGFLQLRLNPGIPGYDLSPHFPRLMDQAAVKLGATTRGLARAGGRGATPVRIAGKSDEEIRTLVAKLEAARKAAA